MRQRWRGIVLVLGLLVAVAMMFASCRREPPPLVMEPQAVRERIAIDAREDSYIYDGADIRFYTDKHVTEIHRIDAAGGVKFAAPTAQATATPGVIVDCAHVGTCLEIRIASTPVAYYDSSGNYTGTGTHTEGSTLDLNGNKLDLDADADTSITADTDDTIDIEISGSDEYTFTASILDVNANQIDLDADNDTSITADTDDQIDIEISGADDFQFTANIFTILAGSKINSAYVTTGTHGVMFSCSGSHGHASAETAVDICTIPANANVVDVLYLITTDWDDGSSATVNCGILGGDVDAFLAATDINAVGDGTVLRAGDTNVPGTTGLIDVGGSNVTVQCTVAEGANDAANGAATLYLTYIID